MNSQNRGGGVGLVGRSWLWGFDEEDCFGSAFTGSGPRVPLGKFGLRFAVFRPICVMFCGVQRFSPCCPLDLRRWCSIRLRPLFSICGEASHAPAFAGVGGALGGCAGAIVSTMINRPPQHGQGSARTRGGSSVSLRSLSVRAFFSRITAG